jgi:hypothetical protein
LYDESFDLSKKGFSISYSKTKPSSIALPKVDMQVMFNPLFIEPSNLQDIVTLSRDKFQIELVEIKQKSVEPETIITIIFFGLGFEIARSFFSGFFNKAGSDFWDLFKEKLKGLSQHQKEKNLPNPKIHTIYKLTEKQNSIEVLVSIFSDQISLIEENGINIDDVNKFILETTGKRRALRAVVELQNELPYWKVVHIIDENGTIIKPPLPPPA